MAEPLIVVGLLSGGKDSCYNLCHCAKQGHKIAALATLAPPQGKDELDSYMYQTVGHDAVHLIAEAMQVPLYRATITGEALNQTSSYGNRLPSSSSHKLDSSDETEDLFRLLQMVKQAQPQVNAVSVGAILSNYQRIRVEHVALRAELQLLPLSFLWQRDQADLLDEMCQAGMNSILIKTAGAGLGEVDLGKNLLQMRSKLHKLHNIYGAHICGEGGEFETLTLDCPLFKKRIVLDKTTTVVHSDSSFASVFYLQINLAHLEDKKDGWNSLQDVTIPPLLDILSLRTLQVCEKGLDHTMTLTCSNTLSTTANHTPSITRKGNWCAFGSITGHPSSDLEKEFRSAFDILMDLLEEQSLSPAQLIHLNVYLSSQTHFATLNKIYSSYFGVDPPSRACVGINMQELASSTCHLILEATAFDDGADYKMTTNGVSTSTALRCRKVLHVQGRSYWAAANIGPYSQSVNAHSRITIAGQIGLMPTTLQLANLIPLQITLALQHARRIFKATLEGRAERQKGWIEGCICWLDDARLLAGARNAWQAQSRDNDDDEEDEDKASWESQWLGKSRSTGSIPVTYVVLFSKALPRSAAVEWQLFAHDGKSVVSEQEEEEEDDDDADEEDEEAPLPVSMMDIGSFGSFSAELRVTKSKRGASSFGIAHLNKKTANASDTFLASQLSAALNLKILYSQQDVLEELQVSTGTLSCSKTFLPVCACYDAQLQQCDATLIWQAV